MNRFAWSLPLLLIAAPAIAGIDGDQAVGIQTLTGEIGATSIQLDTATPGDGDIVLAQDSTSAYDLKFEYSNSSYNQAEVANFGEAFKDGASVATAEVTDVQEIAANQARVRVKVTHFDEAGDVAYEGVVHYRKGLPGNIISENTISGAKDHHIFTTWPTW